MALADFCTAADPPRVHAALDGITRLLLPSHGVIYICGLARPFEFIGIRCVRLRTFYLHVRWLGRMQAAGEHQKPVKELVGPTQSSRTAMATVTRVTIPLLQKEHAWRKS